MSKKFKGKACTYCTTPASSEIGEHVFAREFFPPEKRGNLPKVPSCAPCNAEKAALEHYVASVLPFGGRHADAHRVFSARVPPRLARNASLRRQLSERHEEVWYNEGGLLKSTIAIPVDTEKVVALFRFIVRGLITHHWRAIVPSEYHVNATMLSRTGVEIFRQFLGMNPRSRVQRSIGEGAFEYHGIQAKDDPCLTFWLFRVYGGVVFVGDPAAPGEATTLIGAATSRRHLDRLFAANSRAA